MIATKSGAISENEPTGKEDLIQRLYDVQATFVDATSFWSDKQFNWRECLEKERKFYFAVEKLRSVDQKAADAFLDYFQKYHPKLYQPIGL